MHVILIVSALIVFFDQATKFLAFRYLQELESISVIPNIFHLSYIQNTGIAFGLFQNHPEIWSIIISMSVLFLMIGIGFFVNQLLWRKIAYSFILGGAIGNWIDRIRLHYVVDFLDFRIWPVFNLADSFITIGVVIFIWYAIRGQ